MQRVRLRMSRNLSGKHVVVVLVILTATTLLYNRLSSTEEMLGPILLLNDGTPCNVSLESSAGKNLEKVYSYKFPKVQQYLKDLFPESVAQTIPKFPTFLTALDASHYKELLGLIQNTTTVRKKYNITLVIYDMGLTRAQKSGLKGTWQCDIRKFPFDKFPKHVGYMQGYAWKPIAMQLVMKEHPFVFWMDTSTRFTQTDLEPLFEKARTSHVMARRGDGVVAQRTNLAAFTYLGEQPCTFRDVLDFQGGFIIIHGDPFTKNYYLKPWVSCALTKECMVLTDNPKEFLNCESHGIPRYSVCHRFDQSISSILIHRLFHPSAAAHSVDRTEVVFCRAPFEMWLYPDFVNKMLFNSGEVTCD